MDKQTKKSIRQTVSAAILSAAILVPIMVSVNAASKSGQATQATKSQPMPTEQIVLVFSNEIETTQAQKKQPTYWDSIPLDTELQNYIVETSNSYGIDPSIIMAMIYRESGFSIEAIGDGGQSYGLMQIKKCYHLDRMESLGATNLLDPYQNVTVGIDFLSELLGKYDGNIGMALTAYNCGATGAYNNYFSQGVYANDYARAVMEKCRELQRNYTTEKDMGGLW